MRNAISKVQNNPLMAVIGGVTAFYYINKKMPNSNVKNKLLLFAGVGLLGAVAGAYASSYVKSISKNPIGL